MIAEDSVVPSLAANKVSIGAAVDFIVFLIAEEMIRKICTSTNRGPDGHPMKSINRIDTAVSFDGISAFISEKNISILVAKDQVVVGSACNPIKTLTTANGIAITCTRWK